MQFEPEEKILTFEEIRDIVRVAAGMGIRKLRLTGGEPLVRKDIEKLVGMLSAIPGIQEISMTTNGMFLASKAQALKEAGLDRINISLDSLREDRFARITRGGKLHKVLEAVRACQEAGIRPIKLNVVVIRGINDDEILDFIRLTEQQAVHVRFIEYMPIGHHDESWKTSYVPLTSVLESSRAQGWNVVPAGGVKGNGPSENYRIEGFQGSFGLIHPVSDHFCDSCNRLRLTADGYVQPCLFWSDAYYLKPIAGDETKVKDVFLAALAGKPSNHEMAQQLFDQQTSHEPTARRMSQIGG